MRGTASVGEDCLPCIYTCYCWAEAWVGAPLAGGKAELLDEPPIFGVEEVVPGRLGWLVGPLIGDCLEGHEIGCGSVSILSLFFLCISSLNGLLTCIFCLSSGPSSGELEYDLNSSPGCLGGVLARPEPLRMKLLPKSYFSGRSDIFFLA